MREERLLELIGQVDDKLVTESLLEAPGRAKRQWTKWAGVAVACLALGLVWLFGSPDEPEVAVYEPEISRNLSILALDIYEPIIRQAAAGQDFELDISTFSLEERGFQSLRLQAMLMSGRGYDMFFWDGSPYWIHGGLGFLQDFNELITNREDFYTNVLEAFELNGGLYFFPLSFDFVYIGINADLPESIVNRFKQHSTITNRQIMDIFLELESGLNIGFNDPMRRIIGDFIDFENRISHLNDGRFAAVLEDRKHILETANEEGYAWPTTYQQQMQVLAENYAFIFMTGGGLNMTGAGSVFFGTEDSPFVHFIPLADENGNLIIDHHSTGFEFEFENEVHRTITIAPIWGSVGINAAGNGQLAWEFTQHLISAAVNHDTGDWRFSRNILTTPIKRSYTRQNTMSVLEFRFRDDIFARQFYGLPETAAGQQEPFEDALAILEYYNAMPAVLRPAISSTFYEDAMQNFMLGFSTAQQAAEEIHNRVTLWLIE